MSLFAALLLGVAPLAGPPAPPVPPPPVAATADPAALAAAQRLLDRMEYESMMQRMIDSMSVQSRPELRRQIEAELDEPLDEQLFEAILAVNDRHLRKFAANPDLRKATAMLYARYFTAAELDRMAAMFGDPVMRKWMDQTPKLMGDLMPLLLAWGNRARPAILEEIKQLVIDHYAAKKPATD